MKNLLYKICCTHTLQTFCAYSNVFYLTNNLTWEKCVVFFYVFLCFFLVLSQPMYPPFRAMQKCKVLLTLCLPRIWFNMVYARRPASVVSKSCPWWHRHKYRQQRRKSSRSTAASSGVTLRST